jgi:ElaB/YqjD/DUF883 family membrane-anchored ribosome-binding protein
MEAVNRVETEKGDLKVKLDNAMEKAKEVGKRLQEQTAAAVKATDKTIRDHPYQTIGIAFGVGVLLGVLAMRSRRD